MARRIASPVFVGREEELGALAAALARVRAGQASTVLIAGDAGVGKTRLLEEFKRRADADAVRWLVGDCIPLGEHRLPYAPVTAALRGLARAFGETPLLLASAPELARLLPELAMSGETSDRHSADESFAQARLFEQLLALIVQLSAQGVVAIAIEDLHWADQSTRDFLSFLIRNAREDRLLLICTYRTDELHRGHPLRPFLAEHERVSSVRTVEVRPFSRPELGALLEGILGGAAERELAEQVFKRSDGNAFFAEELLAAAEAGATGLPPTVRDVLMLRVEALSQPTQGMLRLAAASGRRVPHALLADVVDPEQPSLDEMLREAIANQVLTNDPADETYAFRHALLREAVYADLLPGERARIHLALAEALCANRRLAVEGGGNAAAELAFHWRAAHRDADALAASIEAGLQAERTYASAEANRHFESALELWDAVDDAARRAKMSQAEVQLRAAQHAGLSGLLERAVELARQAIAAMDPVEDPVRVALAHEALGRFLWWSGDSGGALGAYREAVGLLPAEPPSAERARALAAEGQILMLRGRAEESRSRCEQAIAIARHVGARAEEAHALCTLGSDLAFLGDYDLGIEHLSEAKLLAEELSSVELLGRVYQNLADGLAQAGRFADAVEVGIEGAERLRTLGRLHEATYMLGDIVTWLVRLGRLDEAEMVADSGLEDRQQGLPMAMLLSSRAEVDLHRGKLDAAARNLARAARAAGATDDSMHLGFLTDRPAQLALLRGDPEHAAALVADAINRVGDDEYVIYTARTYAVGVRAHVARAERARALGDSATVTDAERSGAALVERLERLLEPGRWLHSPPPESAAHGALAAAELERLTGKARPATWALVAAHWERLAFPLELAYARWREAEAILHDGGSRADAAAALVHAAALSTEAGATLLADEIQALARRARIAIMPDDQTQPTAPPISQAERLGLTAREIEVLALLAAGRTNPQIGAALFISPKTASAHVSHILAKLDVKSRVAAATAAHRLDLLPSDAVPGPHAHSGHQ